MLNAILQAIVADGGEGVVLRKVGSYYENGRSPSLLKLKKVCIVIVLCSY